MRGQRLAVGATRHDIRNQFAGEALVIGTAGSVVGLALGSGAALVVAALGAWPESTRARSTPGLPLAVRSLRSPFDFLAALGRSGRTGDRLHG